VDSGYFYKFLHLRMRMIFASHSGLLATARLLVVDMLQ